MKKNIIRSLIAAVLLEAVGVIINLLSYCFSGEFLLAQKLYGGEWEGWRGFGMVLNKVWPMFISDTEPIKVSSWISFDFTSLYVTLVMGFWLSFIVCTIISFMYPVRKKVRK